MRQVLHSHSVGGVWNGISGVGSDMKGSDVDMDSKIMSKG